jgi:uncharacterized protein GlcG (DUF336 family)
VSDARAAWIDLARARTIVDRAIAHARSNDFPPMTVAVLDTAGIGVASASQSGSIGVATAVGLPPQATTTARRGGR